MRTLSHTAVLAEASRVSKIIKEHMFFGQHNLKLRAIYKCVKLWAHFWTGSLVRPKYWAHCWKGIIDPTDLHLGLTNKSCLM